MPRKVATQAATKVKTTATRPAAKAAPAKPPKKATALRQKMSKAAILRHLAAETELPRADVAAVLDELELLILRHIKKRAVGEFSLPGLLKIRAVKKPATKKRMGRNPRTGEEVVVPPRKATTVVRVRPLKRLKDMVL